jgi:hypothetical protein
MELVVAFHFSKVRTGPLAVQQSGSLMVVFCPDATDMHHLIPCTDRHEVFSVSEDGGRFVWSMARLIILTVVGCNAVRLEVVWRAVDRRSYQPQLSDEDSLLDHRVDSLHLAPLPLF